MAEHDLVYLQNRDLPEEQGVWVEEQSVPHYVGAGWYVGEPPPQVEPFAAELEAPAEPEPDVAATHPEGESEPVVEAEAKP